MPDNAPAVRLSPQREAFVTAFVMNGGNATEAAVAAGYANPRRQGSRLRTYEDVRQAIERKLAAQQVRVEYSHADWLRDVLRVAQAAEGEKRYSPALKGYELAGRHIGALNDASKLDKEQAQFFSYLGAQMANWQRDQLTGAPSDGPSVPPSLPASE